MPPPRSRSWSRFPHGATLRGGEAGLPVRAALCARQAHALRQHAAAQGSAARPQGGLLPLLRSIPWPSPSSRSGTSRSISRSVVGCCRARWRVSTPSTTCRSRSCRARRWDSSASRAAGSRPPVAPLAMIEPTSCEIWFGNQNVPRSTSDRCGPSGRKCNTSSRTRTPRSIRG